MPSITPATEQRLLSVIEKTAALVNEGLAPNDAIVKAASSADIRPTEIPLIVHAYNTGATNRHRQDSNDPFHKAASFELADSERILEALYPTNVKTAAVIEQETAVSDEYAHSPLHLVARRDMQLKLAAAKVDWRNFNGEEIKAPAPLPVDEGFRQKKAFDQLSRACDAASETRRKVAAAQMQAADLYDSLLGYFRQTDAYPMHVVKEAAVLLHGRPGEVLFDQIAATMPQLVKLASSNVGASTVTVHDLDCTQHPFTLINKFLQKVAEYTDLVAQDAQSQAAYEKQAAETRHPFPVSASRSILDISNSADSRTKQAEFGDPVKMLGAYSIMKNTLGPAVQKLKGPDDDTRLQQAVSQLNDPQHELKMREINTHAMLSDLLTNDPVVSGYSSPEVMEAFNHISQLAPSVSDNRLIMQGALRKYLQQGVLDPFDQSQLLDFETRRRNQTQLGAGHANYA